MKKITRKSPAALHTAAEVALEQARTKVGQAGVLLLASAETAHLQANTKIEVATALYEDAHRLRKHADAVETKAFALPTF
jgi:hypothetical protein